MKPNDDSIESLIRFAGGRDTPSPAATDRAREAALHAWQQGLRSRAKTRVSRRLGWALAAGSCVLVAGAAWWARQVVAPPEVVARVAELQGEVLLDSMALRESQLVHSGGELVTGDARVALNVGDALSLRLDRGSRLRFHAPGHVLLLEGVVYVDSGGLNGATPLRIDTPAGTVRHVGTQFQVRVTGRRTHIQVREGRVVLEGERVSPIDLGAGDGVDAVGGQFRISHGLASHGEAWDWASTLAPRFDVENRALGEFLAWLARERGWQLRFLEPAIQARAAEIRLHGSLDGLEVTEMLERVSLITGVPLALERGVLVVGSAP
jgi:ferric-dicitrate binding protein FerR (iron transport regulator)